MASITFKCADEFNDWLEARCKEKGRTKTDWINAALTFVKEQIEMPTAVERSQLRMRIEAVPSEGGQPGVFRE